MVVVNGSTNFKMSSLSDHATTDDQGNWKQRRWGTSLPRVKVEILYCIAERFNSWRIME